MKQKKLFFIIGILLTGFLLWRTDFQQVAETLRSLSMKVVLLLLFLQLLNRGLVAYQWQLLVKSQDASVTWSQMWYLNMAGTFFEGITPTAKFGSEGFKVWWLKNHLGIDTTDGTALLLLQKIISGCGFALIVTVTMIISAFHPSRASLGNLMRAVNLTHLTWIIAVLLTLLVIVWVVPRKLSGFHQFTQWIQETGNKLHHDTGRVFTNPAELLMHGGISLSIWLNYALQAWIAAWGMGLAIGFWAMAGAVYLAYTAAMIPLMPGGAGTFEGAMIFVLTGYGLAFSQALVVTLLIRTTTFWISFSISGLMVGLTESFVGFRKLTVEQQ